MKKIILLLSILMILTACGVISGGGKSQGQGVMISFPADQERSMELFPGRTIKFQVSAENLGKYDTDVNFAVHGIDEAILSFNPVQSVSLKGQTELYPGDLEYVDISSRGATPLTEGTTTHSISIDACYRYKTILTAPICINADGLNSGQCSSSQQITDMPKEALKEFSNQGAPIGVTGGVLKSSTTGEGVFLTLTLTLAQFDRSNQATIIRNDRNACDTTTIVDRQDIGKVLIRTIKLGSRELTCPQLENQDGFFDISRQSSLICHTEIRWSGQQPEPDHTSTLQLEMEYNMKHTISFPITIHGRSLTDIATGATRR